MQQSDLEALADEIQDLSLHRLLTPTDVPIKRNPFRHRAKPNTTVIWEAAMRKLDERA
jgi:hypothetical protein